MKEYKDLTKAEGEEILIPVCDKCFSCACHDGYVLYLCNEYSQAITKSIKVPIYYLEQINLESPDFWQPYIDDYFENATHEEAETPFAIEWIREATGETIIYGSDYMSACEDFFKLYPNRKITKCREVKDEKAKCVPCDNNHYICWNCGKNISKIHGPGKQSYCWNCLKKTKEPE